MTIFGEIELDVTAVLAVMGCKWLLWGHTWLLQTHTWHMLEGCQSPCTLCNSHIIV